jgi:cell division protein FtsQ
MQNWKNILFKVLWSIAAIALVVLFVVAWQEKGGKKCKDIQVELVGDNTKALFLYEQEILGLINDEQVKTGQPIASINLSALEKMLENSGWIKNAELYIDNKLVLQVKIEQRVPIARVFTVGGNSFYMDNEGRRLPLRQLSVLRLPIFTGFTSDEPKLSKPDSLLLHDMVYFANTIKSDSFFTAQIAQINIASNGDFELVPTIGDHLVLIGKVENLEDKLNRLYTFYKKVWVPSGINAFQVLDCRFDKQIVALKKGLQPIQFTGMVLPFENIASVMDSTIKAEKLKMDTIKPKLDTSKTIVKLPKPKAELIKPKIVLKKKLIVKPAVKKMPAKLNNKSNIKTLNNVKKTAKAVMPKKSDSKTTTNN